MTFLCASTFSSQVGKRSVPLTSEAVAYHIPLDQIIQRQLLLDPAFSEQLKDWGDLPRAAEGTYSDVQDGEITKSHAKLSLPREAGAPIRLGIGTYADDVEVVNPIGAARVKHKVTLHYATSLNLPPHLRMNLDNIFLIAVVLSKHQAAVGPCRVLQGSNRKECEQANACSEEACSTSDNGFTFGDTMRKFAREKGISFTVPRWTAPGFDTRSYQAYLVLVSADTLAAAELIGFKRGFGPKVFKPCWQCHVRGVRVCINVSCATTTRPDLVHMRES